MKVASRAHRWAARSGLILAPAAWVVNQQFTSELTYAKCSAATTAVVLSSGLLCAAAAAAGLLVSWYARRAAAQEPTIAFTATLGALAAALALLVIVAGTAAGFLLPGCFR
jgi:hypothetical protein